MRWQRADLWLIFFGGECLTVSKEGEPREPQGGPGSPYQGEKGHQPDQPGLPRAAHGLVVHAYALLRVWYSGAEDRGQPAR